jgi:hypothetical protein
MVDSFAEQNNQFVDRATPLPFESAAHDSPGQRPGGSDA